MSGMSVQNGEERAPELHRKCGQAVIKPPPVSSFGRQLDSRMGCLEALASVSARYVWSGRRDLNPGPLAPQARCRLTPALCLWSAFYSLHGFGAPASAHRNWRWNRFYSHFSHGDSALENLARDHGDLTCRCRVYPPSRQQQIGVTLSAGGGFLASDLPD
jgi:hypothetical protein